MCFTIIFSKTFHVIIFIIFGRVSLCFRWNFIFYHFIKDLNHVIRVPLHDILDILRYTHWKAVAILHTQMSCSQSGDRSLSRFLIRQQLCVNIAYAHSMKYSIYSVSYFVQLMNVPSLSINQDYSGMRDLTLHSSTNISFIIIRQK